MFGKRGTRLVFYTLTRDIFLNGWYDWSVDNWGTKWDCGGYVSLIGLEDVDKALKENKPEKELTLHYTFQTAWAPCTPIVAEMARQFPTLSVKHDFTEEGCLIAGIDEYEDGVSVSNISRAKRITENFVAIRRRVYKMQ